jgi:hypothetical protein
MGAAVMRVGHENGCSAAVLHRCCSEPHATLQSEKENREERDPVSDSGPILRTG